MIPLTKSTSLPVQCRLGLHRTALCFALTLFSSLSGGEKELLELALRSGAERSGDYDAVARAWLQALPSHATDWRAEILPRRLSLMMQFLRHPTALIPDFERALESTYSNGTVRQALIDPLADLYRQAGREEDRARITRDRGFLLDWLVVGPFGKGHSAPFLESFAPEKDPSLDVVMKDGWQELRWRKLERRNPEPLVNPAEFVYPTSGVSYFLAQLEATEATEVMLQRMSEHRLQVWVNGILVANDDPFRERIENRRATPIRIARGWNRLLVKVQQGGFWVRLSSKSWDPLPAAALLPEKELTLHPVTGEGNPTIEGATRTSALNAWRAWIEEIHPNGEVKAEDLGLIADAHTAFALMAQFYGRDDLALAESERALELRPDDAWTHYHSGDVIRETDYLPQTVRKDRSLKAFQAAQAKDPDLIPVYERLARFLQEDEKPAQAALKVKEALEKNPTFLRGLHRLSSIFHGKAWLAEEIEIQKKIQELAPALAAPCYFFARHYEQHDNPAAAQLWYQRACERDGGQANSHLQLARVNLQQGHANEAEAEYRKAMERAPDSADVIRSLAEFLADEGRLDEALALARDLSTRNPLHPGGPLYEAELLERSGRAEAALAAIKKARELDPGEPRLRRTLARLEPGATGRAPPGAALGDEFWLPYDEKLEDWFLQVPSAGPLVEKAASITVLDITVVRVEVDGSRSEYVHQASKLLSEESKEELSNVQTPGELVTLRTVSPSGESLEPVPGQGEHSWVMPGMQRGAFVEYAFRDEDSGHHSNNLSLGSFFFQDLRFRQSFLLSRYVLLLPKGMDLGVLETKLLPESREPGLGVEFARVQKTVRELPDGSTAIHYEARNVPKLEREQFMPASDEYLPNVAARQKETWDEVANKLRERFRGATLPTRELETAARDATKGIADSLDRAKALYVFVQKTIPTEGNARQAATVLLEKAGNRNLLLKALLEIAEVPSSWAFLRSKEEMTAKTDWNYPQASFFPYPYIALELAGKQPTYLSLTDRQTPFGRLPEFLEGGKALILSTRSHKITHIDAGRPEESAVKLTARFTLSETTDVACDLQLETLSVSMYAQKEQFKTLPAFQKDVVLRGFANQMFPGAKVKVAEMPGLEDMDKPFGLRASLTAPKLLKKSKDEYLLKPVFQPSNLVKQFAGRSKREHPFHFRSQRIQRDSIRLEPGETYKLDRTPSDVTLASSLGTYSLTYRSEGETVVVTREVTLLPGRLTASEFAGFVEFCEKADAGERESVVFKKRVGG